MLFVSTHLSLCVIWNNLNVLTFNTKEDFVYLYKKNKNTNRSRYLVCIITFSLEVLCNYLKREFVDATILLKFTVHESYNYT